jgi:hypothetical protein
MEFEDAPQEISMANKRPPAKIYPKVSTLPRQRTEAAHYLDMYKLTVEKKRIQQELENLEQRRQRLYSRLAEIDQQTDALGGLAGTIRLHDGQRYGAESSRPVSSGTLAPNVYLPDRQTRKPTDDYTTVLLEY